MDHAEFNNDAPDHLNGVLCCLPQMIMKMARMYKYSNWFLPDEWLVKLSFVLEEQLQKQRGKVLVEIYYKLHISSKGLKIVNQE